MYSCTSKMSEQQFWLSDIIKNLDRTGLYSKDMKNKLLFCVSMTSVALYLLVNILDIVYNAKNVNEITEDCAYFYACDIGFSFSAVFVLNRDKIHRLVQMLRTELRPNEYTIHGEKTNKKLAKFDDLFLYFIIFLFGLFAIDSYAHRTEENVHDAKSYGMPLRMWFPFSLQNGFWFVFALLFEACVIVVCCACVMPIAVLFACMLVHVRCQLSYLALSVRGLQEERSDDARRARLKECLKLHTDIIDMVKIMQDSYFWILLLHNVSASIISGFSLYEISSVSLSDSAFLPFFGQLCYSLLESYIYCYYCQRIIDESDRVGQAAYFINWYDYPADIVLDLRLLILRTQRPLRIRIFTGSGMSLESYINIIAQAYSYFLFLQNLNISNKKY